MIFFKTLCVYITSFYGSEFKHNYIHFGSKQNDGAGHTHSEPRSTPSRSSVYTLNIIASCDLSIMVHVQFTALFEGDLTKIDMHLKNVQYESISNIHSNAH